MKKLLFALALLAFGLCAAEISGVCVRVADGDTLTVLDNLDGGRFRVRLYGVDAPEKAQAFGAVSKKHLAALCLKKPVFVRFRDIDRYGRIVGRVYVRGVDVSGAMLSAGLAWHYKRYDTSNEYSNLERQAKAGRRGLWFDKSPVPPWQFRHSKKPQR